MTATAAHGEVVTDVAPVDTFTAEVDVVRAATARLLALVHGYDDVDIEARSVAGLGARRHVLARLERHSERCLASLEGRSEPHGDDTMLRMPRAAFVERLTTSLHAVLDALDAEDAASPSFAALVACSEQRSWLELTQSDLDAGGVWAPAPAVAAAAVAVVAMAAAQAPVVDDAPAVAANHP